MDGHCFVSRARVRENEFCSPIPECSQPLGKKLGIVRVSSQVLPVAAATTPVGDRTQAARAVPGERPASSSAKYALAGACHRACRPVNSSWARRRGQPAGSSSEGRSGSRNGNFRHACTSSVWMRNDASSDEGRIATKSEMNASYAERTESRSQAAATTSRHGPARRAKPRTRWLPPPSRPTPRRGVRPRARRAASATRRRPSSRVPPRRCGFGAGGAPSAAPRGRATPARATGRPRTTASRTNRFATLRSATAPPSRRSTTRVRDDRGATLVASRRARCAPAPAGRHAAYSRPRRARRPASPATPARRAGGRTRRGSSAAVSAPPARLLIVCGVGRR